MNLGLATGSAVRRAAQAAGWAAAAAAGGLAAQVYYAGHRRLPHSPDLECSGSFGHPDGVPIRIVALGDSVLTGAGLSDPSDMWLRQAVRRLPYRYRIVLSSLARGGARSREVRDRQLPVALAMAPDVAVVSGGANDLLRGVPARLIEHRLSHVAELLSQTAEKVIFMGIGDLGSIPRAPQPLAALLTWRSRRGDRAHRRMERINPKVTTLSMWEGVSQSFRSDPGLFGPDLFHPNASGHRLWADAVHGPLLEACRHIAAARQQIRKTAYPQAG